MAQLWAQVIGTVAALACAEGAAWQSSASCGVWVPPLGDASVLWAEG